MNLPRYAKLAGLGGRLYPASGSGPIQWRTSRPESHLNLRETADYLQTLMVRGDIDLEVFERHGSSWRSVEKAMMVVQRVEPDKDGYEVLVELRAYETRIPLADALAGVPSGSSRIVAEHPLAR